MNLRNRRLMSMLVPLFMVAITACVSSRDVKPESFDSEQDDLGIKIDSVEGPKGSYSRNNFRYTPKNDDEAYFLVRVRYTNLSAAALKLEPLFVKLEKHIRTGTSEKTGKTISVPNLPAHTHYCSVDTILHEFGEIPKNFVYIFAPPPYAFETVTLKPGETTCRQYAFFFRKDRQPESLVLFEAIGEGDDVRREDTVTVDLSEVRGR